MDSPSEMTALSVCMGWDGEIAQYVILVELGGSDYRSRCLPSHTPFIFRIFYI